MPSGWRCVGGTKCGVGLWRNCASWRLRVEQELTRTPPPACNALPGLHVARLRTKAISPTPLRQLNPRYPNPTPDLPRPRPPRGPSRLQQATPSPLGGHWVVPGWSSQKCSMQHPPAPLGTAALTGWAMRDGGGASWPQKPSTSVQLLL